MDEKPKFKWIDPKLLKIPPVRITSVFDDETFAAFQADVEKNKIEDPLKIIEDGEDLWVVDGRHRRDEALLKGFPTVPCIVRKGSMVDVLLRNLVSDRLRGKTKASEEVIVVKELWENYHIGIDQIVEKTGSSQERVEQLIQISGAAPEVWEALDEGRIKVCHAFQLARMIDRTPQVRMLQYVLNVRTNCKDLKEAVDDALRMIAERAKGENNPEVIAPPPLPVAKCSICKQDNPVNEMVAPPMCRSCFARSITAYDERMESVVPLPEKRSPIAEAIVGGLEKTEGGS